MPTFTPTQGRYLSFIYNYTDGFGLPPSESEIAKAIGVAPPSVNQMMKTLEKKNLIERKPRVARSIKILIPASEIPKWNGKQITRVVSEWNYVGPPRKVTTLASTGAESEKHAQSIYCFEIELLGFEPKIWRRIETPDALLFDFNQYIQTAMGWTNSHMHQFTINRQRYTDPLFLLDDFGGYDAEDYSGVRLSDLVTQGRSKIVFQYDYDFGEGMSDLLLKVSLGLC